MKHEYELVVDFKEKRKEVLYEGASWHTKKIVDQIRVARNQIAIRFSRTSKIDPQAYLFTPSSPVRIQLYRAACFYLAVAGMIPEVRRIHLRTSKNDVELDKDRLARHWAGCRIDLTLDPETAAKCFSENGKVCYIATTYFLKAQLDSFSHDCFRAAWSGLNALYNGLTDDWREGEKLKKLARYLADHPPKHAQDYVKALPPDFWKGIGWYNYIQSKGLDAAIDEVFQSNLYQDKDIYSHLGGCILSLCKRRDEKSGAASQTAELQGQFEKKLNQKQKRVNEQLRFLTVNYCYMLRNRSFHADKPYPVFGLFDESENGEKTTLTKLLLYVIRDLLPELA